MILLRSFLFTAAFYLWSAVMTLAYLPLFVLPRRVLTGGFTLWARGVVLLLRVVCDVRTEVRGREYTPKGGALVASKHQCMFDFMIMYAILPDACPVMKKELGWIPIYNLYAWRSKVIVVDREGHSKALKKLMADAAERAAGSRQIVIFPEGTRKAPGAPPDYKVGIAGLYRDLNLPVTPIATNSGSHWPAHGFLRRPGLIVYDILPPIEPGLKRGEFMRLLEDRVETASAALLGL